MSAPPTDHNSKSGGLSKYLKSGMDKLQQTSAQLPALNQIPHTIRQAQAQYNPHQAAETLKLQLAIKSLSGVVRDTEALSRETQAYSKSFQAWGKEEEDASTASLTDTVSILLHKSGELYAVFAKKLEGSRQSLKEIRNYENDIVLKRRHRETLALKLSQAQASSGSSQGASADANRLKSDLQTLENELSLSEARLSSHKQVNLQEALITQWAAHRELGEKLAIVGAYGDTLTSASTNQTQPSSNAFSRNSVVKLEAALREWNISKTAIQAPDLRESQNDTQPESFSGPVRTSPTDSSTSYSNISPSHGPPEANFTAQHGFVTPIEHKGPLASSSQTTTASSSFHGSVPGTEASTIVLAPFGGSPIPSVDGRPSINLTPISPPSRLPATASSSTGMQAPFRNPHLDTTDERMKMQHTQDSSLLPANVTGSIPNLTVAEVGAPLVGTGGPSSGQLHPRQHPSAAPTNEYNETSPTHQHFTQDGLEQEGDIPPPAYGEFDSRHII